MKIYIGVGFSEDGRPIFNSEFVEEINNDDIEPLDLVYVKCQAGEPSAVNVINDKIKNDNLYPNVDIDIGAKMKVYLLFNSSKL